jgi:hypothetical protein
MFDKDTLAQLHANYLALQPSQTAPKAKPKKKGGRGGSLTSFISEGGALGGAAAGAAAGSIVPVVGTAVGGILGAGLGAFGGRLVENKVRDDRLGVGDAAKEAALSSILAGPLRLGKYAVTAGKGVKAGAGLEDALVEAATASSKPGLIKRGLTKTGEKASERAANRFLEVTPTAMQRLLDEGVDPQKLISKWGKQLGTSYDDMIKNSGTLIKQAEEDITKTAGVTGRNIRVDGSDIIKRLQAEAKKIKNELGGGTRYQQMQTIISDAKKKYKNGLTVQQARNILREANQRFGASVLDDTGDAVARAAQKLEANVLRDSLKTRFPTIQKSLDDQSELIQLRELLKHGRAVNKSKKGPNFGRIDLTRPGTVIDALTSSPAVSRRLAGRQAATDPAGFVKPAFGGAMAGTRGSLGEALLNSSDQLDQSSINQQTTATAANMPSIAQITPELSQVDANLSTSNSPFSPENLQSSVQQIIANGGSVKDAAEFVSLAEALMNIQGMNQGAKKPMSAESAKVTSNAQLGLQALDDFEGIIGQNPSALRNSVIPGRSVAGGVLGRALGTQELDAARQQVVDVIARLRTGAAITNDEAARFTQFLPVAADSPEVQSQKINYLRQQFADILQRTGGGTMPSTLEDALLAQGAF